VGRVAELGSLEGGSERATVINPRQLARLGWILWIASWVTPDFELSGIGALAVGMSTIFGVRLVLDGAFEHHNLWLVLGGLGMLAGVAVNLTIVLPTTRWQSLVSIAVPFISIACVMSLFPRPLAVLEWLFIYPWIAGIVLIHLARIQNLALTAEAGQQEVASHE
jgi:hypothetical protein